MAEPLLSIDCPAPCNSLGDFVHNGALRLVLIYRDAQISPIGAAVRETLTAEPLQLLPFAGGNQTVGSL